MVDSKGASQKSDSPLVSLCTAVIYRFTSFCLAVVEKWWASKYTWRSSILLQTGVWSLLFLVMIVLVWFLFWLGHRSRPTLDFQTKGQPSNHQCWASNLLNAQQKHIIVIIMSDVGGVYIYLFVYMSLKEWIIVFHIITWHLWSRIEVIIRHYACRIMTSILLHRQKPVQPVSFTRQNPAITFLFR